MVLVDHPGLGSHGSDGPSDSTDRHCALFGPTGSLGARGADHLRHGGHIRLTPVRHTCTSS